jgi:hypothetical protein
MPRPRTGSIRRKQTTLGIAHGLRFKYRGEEHYHHLGGSWEGWTDERADEDRRYVMAQVERGEYVPQRRDAAPPIGVGDVPTFQVLASLVLDRVRRRVASRGAMTSNGDCGPPWITSAASGRSDRCRDDR